MATKKDYPNLRLIFSENLAQTAPWFPRVRVLFDESNLCDIETETTFPELIQWRSTTSDFINDQIVLSVQYSEFCTIAKNLQSEIRNWKSKFGSKFVTLAVYLENKQSISKDIETKISTAQIDSNFNVRYVRSPHDILQLLVCMTKATAEKYHKILRYEVLGFEGTKKTSTNGTDSWCAMLEIFFAQASTELAKAVAARYPSASVLRDALLKKPATEVFQGVLASTGQPPFQRTFKIGPETANKLYNFFTQEDPDFLV